ncbi:MAG: twin-arginine translocase subunit TatC [bacterium]
MDISNDKIFLFLQRLRKKIIAIFILVFLASLLCYFFKENIWYLAQFPYLKIKPGNNLIFISPIEALSTNLGISLFGGVFLVLPFIFYQVVSLFRIKFFISVLAFLLFIIGAVFSYYIVIPQALRFFLQFENEFLSAQWTVSRYLSFFLWTLFSFGLMFEMPLILYFLAKFNIIKVSILRKNRRYAVLIIFIAASILTPGQDVVSQVLLAFPMIILYELGIWVSCL